MRKELRPVHDLVSCDLCQRTILKGERIETFVGGGDRQRVCELCGPRARRSGWMRESEIALEAPERERQRPRPSLWARARGWAEEQGIWGAPPPDVDDGGSPSRPPDPASEPVAPSPAQAPDEPAAPTGRPFVPEEASPPAAETVPSAADSADAPVPPVSSSPAPPARDESPADEDAAGPSLDERRARAAARAEERRQARLSETGAAGEDEIEHGEGAASVARRPGRGAAGAGLRDLISGRRREPRQVHAFPSGRWAKIERALELFNGSEHRRTMAGVGRTLGEPWVSAAPLEDGPAAREVGITVAWELSWYRFKVDIDDVEPAVVLLDRGNELEDLDESLRSWNVGADAQGRLALAVEAVS